MGEEGVSNALHIVSNAEQITSSAMINYENQRESDCKMTSHHTFVSKNVNERHIPQCDC